VPIKHTVNWTDKLVFCHFLWFSPNHLRNHLKVPQSSFEGHVKHGNSFSAELITAKIVWVWYFPIFICSICFSNSPLMVTPILYHYFTCLLCFRMLSILISGAREKRRKKSFYD